MAEFIFEGKKVYYETYGEGKPLLLLNGIMMSCASWKEFIEPLSAQNMLILVDMLDQGKSEKMTESYDHAIQIRLVDALLNELQLESCVIAGISYGSEVGLEYAILHPDRVERLLLFNATAATGPWLDDIGKAWNLASANPESYYYTSIPVIYSPRFYTQNNDWMERRRKILYPVFSNEGFINAMIRLTNSSSNYDVRDRLDKIMCPTLIVSCQQDYLTPVDEQKYLADHIADSHYLIIQNSGHASMYEQPMLFASLILGFANASKAKYNIT
ncbi:MAG: alpha/beta hydrolase [Clostridia bacterium]|nr:alpha/beta hydrolase [Oscillospiraceae bacterium]MBS5432435.1 alpha/beta hydrolase [Bacillota bacterium]PWM19974.1 MAG: alpha/beta hydrolase [Clostridia bacterium]